MKDIGTLIKNRELTLDLTINGEMVLHCKEKTHHSFILTGTVAENVF